MTPMPTKYNLINFQNCQSYNGVAGSTRKKNKHTGLFLAKDGNKLVLFPARRGGTVGSNPANKKNSDKPSMAGVAGFEPTNARVKVLCLTTWRHPIN